MTNLGPNGSRPLQVVGARRWRVGGIYVTLKPAPDGRSIRIYTKDRKDLGKCGVLMKIRFAAPGQPNLCEKSVNAALLYAIRSGLRNIIHLDVSESGPVRVSFAADESAPGDEVDGTNPRQLAAEVARLAGLAAGDEGIATPEHLAVLLRHAESRRC